MRRAAAVFILALVWGTAWSQVAPPRSITGILSVLESYQPDAAKIRALHEAAERSPPKTDDRLALKRFYVVRADARVSLGMVREQVADLGKALEFTWPRDGDEFSIRLRLANATEYAGQLSRAHALYAEAAAKATDVGQKQMGEANYAMHSAAYGEFEAARKHLAAAAALMPRFDGSTVETFGNLLTSNVERARGNVALSEGKYAEAETYLRSSIARQLRYMENFRRMPPHGNTEVGNLQLLGRVEGLSPTRSGNSAKWSKPSRPCAQCSNVRCGCSVATPRRPRSMFHA